MIKESLQEVQKAANDTVIHVVDISSTMSNISNRSEEDKKDIY